MKSAFKVLGFASLVVAGYMASASAQNYPDVRLRMGHTVPKTAPVAQSDDLFAQDVAKRSGDKVQIQIFWAGAAGAPAELLDLLSAGSIDMAAFTPSYYPAKVPLLSALSALPLGMPTVPSIQVIYPTLMKEMPALQEEAKANNLHLQWEHVFNEYHLLCTSPIKTLEDLKGKKIRSQGEFFPLALSALGATPVTVLPGQFYEAMQRKVIDCMLLPWDLIATNRLYEIAKYGSNISFGTIVSHIDAYNLNKWNSLTPEVRKLLDDAAADARKKDLEIITKSNNEAVELMKKNGVTFEDFPDQKKMEAMLPNFIDVWADKQKQAGRGDAAAAIAKRWKELAAQHAPKS